MGFRLKLREPLPDGLKRVFREQVESALELCRHPAKQRGVTVHEVRKHLKKLRAAMRLAIPAVGKNRHTREDHCVRKIGRLVSDLRDAQVRLQTLIQLRDETSKGPEDSPFSRIEELLSLERESFSAAFAGWQKQAVPQLERVEARLMKWPLGDLPWKQVCGAVAKIYKRGQRGLFAAEPTIEAAVGGRERALIAGDCIDDGVALGRPAIGAREEVDDLGIAAQPLHDLGKIAAHHLRAFDRASRLRFEIAKLAFPV